VIPFREGFEFVALLPSYLPLHQLKVVGLVLLPNSTTPNLANHKIKGSTAADPIEMTASKFFAKGSSYKR
jgi:hypothetical protein